MKTRLTALVLSLATLFSGVLMPVSASAAGWGRGTFTGKVRGQFRPQPLTSVAIAARGDKVRIVKLGIAFDCSDNNQFGLPLHWKTLVYSKAVRVKEGRPEAGRSSTSGWSRTTGARKSRSGATSSSACAIPTSGARSIQRLPAAGIPRTARTAASSSPAGRTPRRRLSPGDANGWPFASGLNRPGRVTRPADGT